MAEANVVAIVGVSAGALVAVVGPIITARATSRGQRRLFAHQRHLADRRELRELLDHAVEAIAVLQRRLDQLHLVYVSGEFAGLVEEPLGQAAKAMRDLELLGARVALRLGGAAPVYLAFEKVHSSGEWIISGIDRHLTLPDVFAAPSSREQEEKITAINGAIGDFVAAARDLVGAELFRAEETPGVNP